MRFEKRMKKRKGKKMEKDELKKESQVMKEMIEKYSITTCNNDQNIQVDKSIFLK